MLVINSNMKKIKQKEYDMLRVKLLNFLIEGGGLAEKLIFE